MHHGSQSEDHANSLTSDDGDTVTVFRPKYNRHELWIWDSTLFLRGRHGGWAYVFQGTEAEMEALAKTL